MTETVYYEYEWQGTGDRPDLVSVGSRDYPVKNGRVRVPYDQRTAFEGSGVGPQFRLIKSKAEQADKELAALLEHPGNREKLALASQTEYFPGATPPVLEHPTRSEVREADKSTGQAIATTPDLVAPEGGS